jgi:hypothetical protein
MNQPEIVAIVAAKSDSRDLVRCLRVNKVFQDAFIGYVWRKVRIVAYARARGLTAEAFERHKDLVRELEIQGSLTSETGHECTSAGTAPRDEIELSILRLLPSATCKAHTLRIECPRLSQEWLNALLVCNSVQKLDLRGYRTLEVPPGNASLFLRVCGRMRSLSLLRIKLTEWPTSPQHELIAVQHLSLEDIKAHSDLPIQQDVANAMIRICPNISTLEYGDELEIDDYRALRPVFQGFEHLKSLHFTGFLVDDTCLGRLLYVMNELKELHLHEIGPCCLQELVSYFKGEGNTVLNREVRLCDTLQVMIVGTPMATVTDFFTTVMTEFPRLTQFKCYSHGIEGGRDLEFQPSLDWVC